MFIKCPNCDAQYEVPNDIIPATGRDVQCSSCSKTWFVTGQSGKKIVKDKGSFFFEKIKPRTTITAAKNNVYLIDSVAENELYINDA